MKTVGLVSVWVIVSFGFLGQTAAGLYSGGTGEPNDPYQIANVDDLLELAGNTGDYDKHFILTADINLALVEPNVFTTALIAPDTSTSSGFQGTSFSGTFDGDGHIIRNLRIDDGGASNDYLGLFGQIEASAQIINLGLENVTVTGGELSYFLGGLCGINRGSISNCYTTGAVTGGTDSETFGGLCGGNDGDIINCYAAGAVNGGEGSETLGGLCGWNEGDIINCHAAGAVNGGEGSETLGGLCGWNGGSISNGYATSVVSGGDYSEIIGGLVGEMDFFSGSISNCYATGAVTGGDYSNFLGGLCGFKYNGDIVNCYTTGAVTGGNYSNVVGGLCGTNEDGDIINCYATSAVTSGIASENLGGFCGYKEYGSINNCYFLDTAGPDNGYGEPLDEPNMMIQSNFVNWDFVGEKENGEEDIWRMCEDGVHFPRLAWEYWINGDFVCPDGVEMRDYAYFANWWLEDNCAESENCEGVDRDLSGAVDLTDLYLWGERWLEGR